MIGFRPVCMVLVLAGVGFASLGFMSCGSDMGQCEDIHPTQAAPSPTKRMACSGAGGGEVVPADAAASGELFCPAGWTCRQRAAKGTAWPPATECCPPGQTACGGGCIDPGSCCNGSMAGCSIDIVCPTVPAEAGACYALDIPASWRACTSNADCQAVLTETDHCGTERAVGIAKASVASFDQAERAMEHRCPQGGCPPLATTADDGTTGPFGGALPGVSCEPAGGSGAGACTTSFGATDAGEAGAPDAGAE